jgi:hypothetical protein
MPDEQLTPRERAYLRDIIHERYAKQDMHEVGTNRARYKHDLKAQYKEFGSSDSKRDFIKGSIPGAVSGGIGGGILGAGARSHKGLAGTILGGVGGALLGGGLLGGIGGAAQSHKGNTARQLAGRPKEQVYREGDKILDEDKKTLEIGKLYNRSADVAGLAGLASHPIHAGLQASLPFAAGKLDELDDEHLVEMIENLDLGPGHDNKRLKIVGIDPGGLKPGKPSNDKTHFWNENAFFSNYKNDVNENGKPSHGIIAATSKRMWRPGIVAHELGHANIHKNKGLTGFLQDHLYGSIHPGSQLGKYYGILPTAATSLATKDDDNVGVGAAKGSAIGAAAYSPLLVPEFEASRRGIGAIMKSTMPLKAKVLNSAMMLPAFGTYALSSMGPSAVVGAYNAHLNKQHHEKKTRV